MNPQIKVSSELSSLGFNEHQIFHNCLSPAELTEFAIRNNEGILSKDGALIVMTGQHTGRSPNDKYIVQSESLKDIWWGKINQPITSEAFQYLQKKMVDHLKQKELFIQDVYVGQDPAHRLAVRLISSQAWYGLFCHDLFIPLTEDQKSSFKADVTILHAPGILIESENAGIRSNTFIVLELTKKMILIGGTAYAGEVKKSVFSLINYIMPRNNVFPMHCSANVGEQGDVALFFGLSGTGKTTLSSTSDRQLVGDDEHGWSDSGIFNFEGGCYAKTIRLSSDLEPLIWRAVHRFGSLIENVVINPRTREIDFDSDQITENTRAAYPLAFIDNHFTDPVASHPKNIFFLTADAFGVLPPIARLSPTQAMYYFLTGYTSKLAGTEVNLDAQPQATFSSCFAAPFLPLHPMVYATLLGNRIKQHSTTIWLVNTGWSGGTFGIGKRIHLPYTRAIIKAALSGQLSKGEFKREPFFNLDIPTSCQGIPDGLLDPQSTWQNKTAYTQQAGILVNKFIETMEQYRDQVPPDVVNAGPGAIK
jgi:phosphoenolpyruvate carboxykinase (ATP)